MCMCCFKGVYIHIEMYVDMRMYVYTWRLLCNSLLVITYIYILIRGCNILPKKDLHRSLQEMYICIYVYIYI